MKLCKDCRWFQPSDDPQSARCGHAQAKQIFTSPVDGSVEVYQKTCESFRLTFGGCDVDGRFWETNGIGFGQNE